MKVPLGSEKKHLFCSISLGFSSGSRVNQQQRFTGGRVHFNFYHAQFEGVMFCHCCSAVVGNQKLFEMC